MQTALPDSLLETRTGRQADEILRNCVHCGFCNATCPTYQLTGNELDGPRGRIYLIKQVLEGHEPGAATRLHLDRCLTCRACETTCPSGVDYHRLLDTGRALVDAGTRRPLMQRVFRFALRKVLARRQRLAPLLATARLLRPLLPDALKRKIPVRQSGPVLQNPIRRDRRMLLLDGCVQPAIAPQINNATRVVLDRLGITATVASGSGCCGGLSHHLDATDEAQQYMRNNIDAWWPDIEAGAEAIVITASGCAPTVKEYGHLLADDKEYADKALRVSELARDISEIVAAESIDQVFASATDKPRVAFHSPCTLQHGQRINGVVEDILQRCGYELTPVADAHLCCGSAGTYSLLQPALSSQLRDNKLTALQAARPELIATANIGCHTHMHGHADVPVVHWIELLASLESYA